MKVISIVSQKGGVGKTTISTNLAVEFAREGKKLLFIDTDPQLSASDFRSIRAENDSLTQYSCVQVLEPTLHKDIGNFNFDVIIIDVAGRENRMLLNAMRVSDVIIVPVCPSSYDLWASEDTYKKGAELLEMRPDTKIFSVFNMVRPGTAILRDVDELKPGFEKDYGLKFLQSSLHLRESYKKSAAFGMGVSELKGKDKDPKASEELKALYSEIREVL